MVLRKQGNPHKSTDQVSLLQVMPGVRRAGLPRQSAALTPGARRRGRRLDLRTAQFGNAAHLPWRKVTCAATRTV